MSGDSTTRLEGPADDSPSSDSGTYRVVGFAQRSPSSVMPQYDSPRSSLCDTKPARQGSLGRALQDSPSARGGPNRGPDAVQDGVCAPLGDNRAMLAGKVGTGRAPLPVSGTAPMGVARGRLGLEPFAHRPASRDSTGSIEIPHLASRCASNCASDEFVCYYMCMECALAQGPAYRSAGMTHTHIIVPPPPPRDRLHRAHTAPAPELVPDDIVAAMASLAACPGRQPLASPTFSSEAQSATPPFHGGRRRSSSLHRHHLSAEMELREAQREASDAEAQTAALAAALRREQHTSAVLREQVRALVAERELLWSYHQAAYEQAHQAHQAQQAQQAQQALPLPRTVQSVRTRRQGRADRAQARAAAVPGTTAVAASGPARGDSSSSTEASTAGAQQSASPGTATCASGPLHQTPQTP